MSVSRNRVIRFARVVPDAFIPTKGSAKAAGYDLKSAYEYTVPPRGKEIIDTGLKVQLPEGCYGRIAPRSGLAANNFIDVGAGVVDEDYRGLLKVILFNHSETPFIVNKGDRIAQFICEQIYYPDVEEVQDLSETERGKVDLVLQVPIKRINKFLNFIKSSAYCLLLKYTTFLCV